MTASGSPLTVFRRAIRGGDAVGALTVAHDVAKLPLADALALTLLMRDHDSRRYDRLAARFQSRAIAEVGADLDGAGLLAAALAAIRDETMLRAGVGALRGWLEAHDLRGAVVELDAWQERRG